MTLLSTMQVEAALYNEHTLAWEPFIEPIVRRNSFYLSPWSVTCSIEPVHHSTTDANLQAKQLISLRTDDYLNITITKTGFDLVNYLLTVFGNFDKQTLPTSSDDQPALALVNATGKSIYVSELHGLAVHFPLWRNASMSHFFIVYGEFSLDIDSTRRKQIDFLNCIDRSIGFCTSIIRYRRSNCAKSARISPSNR